MIINLGDAPFKAFITVAYPNGTCTVSLGDKSFTHTGGGTHTFTVNKKGTWTVSAVSESKNVSITSNGQTANVALGYLYYCGTEFTEKMGSFTPLGLKPSSDYNSAKTPEITRGSDRITFSIPAGSTDLGGGIVYMSKQINLSPYNTFCVSMISGQSERKNVLALSNLTTMWGNTTPNLRHTGTTSTTIKLDISSVTNSRYLAIGLAYNDYQTQTKRPVSITIDKIWLE